MRLATFKRCLATFKGTVCLCESITFRVLKGGESNGDISFFLTKQEIEKKILILLLKCEQIHGFVLVTLLMTPSS